MAATYTPIASTTLGSAQATVTFSSISGSYTDIVAVLAIAGLSAQETPRMYFNGDTSLLYSTTWISGHGGLAYSGRRVDQSSFYGIGAYNTGNSTGVSNIIVQIPNYSNTTTYKNMIARSNSAGESVDATVGLYRSTSAITSISFIVSGGFTYSANSMFTLYGIASA